MSTSNGVQHDPLARFYDRLKATRECVSSVSVGERFSMSSSSKWRSGDVRGVHTFVFVVEITATDSTGVEYQTVEIVSESGRPPFADASNGPRAGSCTHLYMVRGLGDGSISRVEGSR
jgi:hypothetical protein